MLKSKIISYCKCENCKEYFETEKKKKYCSRKCQNRVAYKKRTPNHKGQSKIVEFYDGRKMFIPSTN